jgi:hypothetical protein
MSLLLTLLIYAAIAIFGILILGSLVTFLAERSPYQKMFLKGRLPDPAPQGFHPGQPHLLLDKKTPWLGKSFDREAQMGFNIFTPAGASILKIATPLYKKFSVNGEGNTRAFYFRTYTGQGKKDVNTDVFKLDYDFPENPFLIRIILDEIVEIAPREYLGKVHVKFLPGFFVTIGYFGLRQ